VTAQRALCGTSSSTGEICLYVHHEGVWRSDVIPPFIRDIAIIWRCAVNFTFKTLSTDCQLKTGLVQKKADLLIGSLCSLVIFDGSTSNVNQERENCTGECHVPMFCPSVRLFPVPNNTDFSRQYYVIEILFANYFHTINA
jgi:hypothetical protein